MGSCISRSPVLSRVPSRVTGAGGEEGSSSETGEETDGGVCTGRLAGAAGAAPASNRGGGQRREGGSAPGQGHGRRLPFIKNKAARQAAGRLGCVGFIVHSGAKVVNGSRRSFENLLHPADLAVLEHDLDAVGMEAAVGQQAQDHAFGPRPVA